MNWTTKFSFNQLFCDETGKTSLASVLGFAVMVVGLIMILAFSVVAIAIKELPVKQLYYQFAMLAGGLITIAGGVVFGKHVNDTKIAIGQMKNLPNVPNEIKDIADKVEGQL